MYFCRLTWKLAPAWFPLQKACGVIIIIKDVYDACFVQRHNHYIFFQLWLICNCYRPGTCNHDSVVALTNSRGRQNCAKYQFLHNVALTWWLRSGPVRLSHLWRHTRRRRQAKWHFCLMIHNFLELHILYITFMTFKAYLCRTTWF